MWSASIRHNDACRHRTTYALHAFIFRDAGVLVSILCEFSSVAPPPGYMYMSIAVSSGVVSYIVYVNITAGEAGMLCMRVCVCVCMCVCACVCVHVCVYMCVCACVCVHVCVCVCVCVCVIVCVCVCH